MTDKLRWWVLFTHLRWHINQMHSENDNQMQYILHEDLLDYSVKSDQSLSITPLIKMPLNMDNCHFLFAF